MPHYKLIQEADLILSKCGRPRAVSKDANIVPLNFGILISGAVGNNSTNTLTKEIPGDVPFLLRAISSPSPTGLYLQIQLPSGMYALSRPIEISQFQGIGSYRYCFDPELECPVGSKFEISIDNSINPSGATQNISLLMEGAFKYTVKGKGGGIGAGNFQSAATLPRYVQNPNQNIMAPAWMHGYYPNTPKGCEDEIFTYGDGNLNITTMNVGTGPYSAIQQINISQDADFICYRSLFDVRATGTAAGTFLARLRDGSGYALCDDFFDVAQYINASPMAKGWRIAAGDKVFVDLQLVDFSGAGNISIETYLDGVKRFRGGKKAA